MFCPQQIGWLVGWLVEAVVVVVGEKMEEVEPGAIFLGENSLVFLKHFFEAFEPLLCPAQIKVLILSSSNNSILAHL